MTDATVTPPPSEDWLVLLSRAVADETAKLNGKRGGITNVATAIGYSRVAVTLALAGKYRGSTRKLEAKVFEVFGLGKHRCPYLDATIEGSVCRTWQTRTMPRANPDAIKHWNACTNCKFAHASNLKERA